MAWIRNNLWAFVAVVAVAAGALAYAFAAFVERKKSEDGGGEPRRALFKTAMFVAVAGSTVLWLTRTDQPSTLPFQE